MGINRKLLEMLVCPVTGGPLSYNPITEELISDKAQLAYPIKKNIPIMLVSEARILENNHQKPNNSIIKLAD